MKLLQSFGLLKIGNTFLVLLSNIHNCLILLSRRGVENFLAEIEERNSSSRHDVIFVRDSPQDTIPVRADSPEMTPEECNPYSLKLYYRGGLHFTRTGIYNKQTIKLSRTMKRFFAIVSVLTLILLCGKAFAQKNKTDNDYNLQKAYEVLREEGDETKGLELVNKQLKDTPDNVDALLLRARLMRRQGEYGTALSDINHALKVNKPKKSEIPMSTLHWWKGHLYSDLLDIEKSLESMAKAYELAKKDDPENLQGISFDYGNTLVLLRRYDEAMAVFNGMLREDETDAAAMVGKASVMLKLGENREAADLLETARKYAGDYEEVYRFQMKAYRALGENTMAVDAALEYADKADDLIRDSVLTVLELKPSYAVAALKSKAKEDSDNRAYWLGLLGDLFSWTHKYAEAVKCFDEVESQYGFHPQTNLRRSSCYMELGLFDRAIDDVNIVIEKDPDPNGLCIRGIYYSLSGDLDSAIADFSSAIDEDPLDAYYYYRRGWCYEMKGERQKAMEDYNLGIELDEDYPYIYLMRGELLLKDGRKAEADADFNVVIQKDTVADGGSCRMYALHFLGKDVEAVEWMDKMIASDPDDNGNYYDQACLYSLMGRPEDSVTALRTAFEKGYRNFAHIRMDDDMDSLRDLPEFNALMGEYESKHAAYLEEFDLAEQEEPRETTITEISMKRSPGGTFEIPCDINGLPLQMVFDTGASDVTISSVEANFMLKNGYLSERDVKGTRYYQVASGELNAGTVITLREVKVGDAVLKNVEASVVKSQKAPLLLGQSAMERFGTITIDNINNKLIIKH